VQFRFVVGFRLGHTVRRMRGSLAPGSRYGSPGSSFKPEFVLRALGPNVPREAKREPEAKVESAGLSIKKIEASAASLW
ncbi:MAG: hypothetical protein ACO20O_12850, partial [Pseudomonadales bacterium]